MLIGGVEDGSSEERILQEFLASPPKTDRAVMLLYLDNVPSGEAAEILGLTEGALRVRMHRIRKAPANCFPLTGMADKLPSGCLSQPDALEKYQKPERTFQRRLAKALLTSDGEFLSHLFLETSDGSVRNGTDVGEGEVDRLKSKGLYPVSTDAPDGTDSAVPSHDVVQNKTHRQATSFLAESRLRRQFEASMFTHREVWSVKCGMAMTVWRKIGSEIGERFLTSYEDVSIGGKRIGNALKEAATNIGREIYGDVSAEDDVKPTCHAQWLQ